MKNKAANPLSLTKGEVAKIAAEEAARVAIETIDKERVRKEKERMDRRLYNTKLLLRNYRLLKLHTDNAVSEPEQADEEMQSLLEKIWEYSDQGYDDTYIDAIRRSATRTAILINHVDDMVTLYEAYCARSPRQEDMRRYRVVKAMYLSEQPTTAREVADLEQIDTRTVYKDIDAACGPLSALLFGLGALRR